MGCAVEEYAGAAPRPEEMIIRYGPPKRLKYLMLGRGWEGIGGKGKG